MWISALSQCLFIIYHLEITRVAAYSWQFFSINGVKTIIPNFAKNYSNIKTLKLAPMAIKPQNHKNILDRNQNGYDFTDEEIKKLKMWPNGNILYYIDVLSYDKAFRDQLRSFLESVNNFGSVKFLEIRRPPSDDKTRFVMFMNRGEDFTDQDYSPMYFTTEGPQRVRLTYDCFMNGDIYAAVLAIVGVPPQHNAPNRDKYIEVKLENVLDDKHSAFQILQNDQWIFHDLDYDFESASHFDFFKYTKNGQATIVPKVDGILEATQKKKTFSLLDIIKILRLYNYIAKANNNVKLRQTDCKKMYNPGPELVSYEPEVEKLKGKPLDKPKKYLGLPDDNSNSDDNQNDEDSKVDNNSENVISPAKDDENSNDEIPEEPTKESQVDNNSEKVISPAKADENSNDEIPEKPEKE